MKISVILPVYNSEKYIRKSVESVLNQTFSDFELIIVNDGSTDDTINIINLFSDSRIVSPFSFTIRRPPVPSSAIPELFRTVVCVCQNPLNWLVSCLTVQTNGC